MKMKCIGGELDGKEYEVNNRLHDLVRLPLPTEFKISDFSEDVAAFREGRVPKQMINKYAEYRVCAIYGTRSGSTEKLELLYLCPKDWHEWEAIQLQFSK
jgi:hypothetical protein